MNIRKIGKRAQIGKILSAPFIVVIVALVIAVFLASSYAAAKLKSPGQITSGAVIAPYEPMLFKPVYASVNGTEKKMLLFDAYLDIWSHKDDKNYKISFMNKYDEKEFDLSKCFFVTSNLVSEKDWNLESFRFLSSTTPELISTPSSYPFYNQQSEQMKGFIGIPETGSDMGKYEATGFAKKSIAKWTDGNGNKFVIEFESYYGGCLS